MSSKYIPKSRISKRVPISYEWSSDAVDFSNIVNDYVNPHIAEKERIEAISLEQLSFRDLYKFPFRRAEYDSWVYDDSSNFIFQFELGGDTIRNKVVEILNGELEDYNRKEVRQDNGYIQVKVDDIWHNLILIRGWGNLTGVGAHNLDVDYAAKIQDILAEYIIEKLTI